MKTNVRSAVLAAALLSVMTLAASSQQPQVDRMSKGFLPENTLWIPIGSSLDKGLTQDKFNHVLDIVQQVYGPIIAAHGGNLVIDRNWDDGTVNAYAYQQGSEWHIAMFGGLARHPVVTDTGFALVACHELGHHLGGYPKSGGSGWATNEGGADYFATLKCARLVIPKLGIKDADPVAAKACSSAWGDDADGEKKCEDSATAGLSLATLLGELGGTGVPSFGTPDTSVVSAMNDEHPAAQCRLDTYFQGALCTKPLSDDTSATDPAAGGCTAKGGYHVGLRPRCWYFPPADEPALRSAGIAETNRPMSMEKVEREVETLQTQLSSL